MSQVPTRSRVHTGSHWGVYQADAQEGRLAAVIPHPQDPHPAPLLAGVPSAVYHESRIPQPMVRQGYLQHGMASDRAGRGVEPFVPVSWTEALDLIAAELTRVKHTFGNEAIFASSGWASAGHFTMPRTQLFRFLNGFGGFLSQVTNWSFGAASGHRAAYRRHHGPGDRAAHGLAHHQGAHQTPGDVWRYGAEEQSRSEWGRSAAPQHRLACRTYARPALPVSILAPCGVMPPTCSARNGWRFAPTPTRP